MNSSFLITLLIVVIVVGAIIYLVDRLPIDATFKLVAKVVAVVGLVVWLLMALRHLV